MASTSRRLQQRQNLQSTDNPDSSMQDISLQSLQWLESRGLYGSSSLRRGSLPEQILANGYPRRARSSTNGGHHSDAESDASGVSLSSHHGRHHRNRNESGSEYDGGNTNSMRRHHRSRRKRQGSYKLVESDEQWQRVQQQRERQSRSSGRQSSNEHMLNGGQQQSNSISRKSGYMNSGGETETEMMSHASLRRNHQRRRQRSRSRSPGRESGRGRLPAEILQQLEFGLVEPSAETLQGEIPFTNVETTAKMANYR